jgi:EAL domain-containing protein (putative c-di-GMP-specific phosphodiesterase class I)/GGDEF domain-containing protein
MKTIKKEMIKVFIISAFGLLGLLYLLYREVTNFIIDQEVQKARLLAHSLVYTRKYLASVSPYVEIKSKTFHPFALTPAYTVKEIASLIEKNEKIFIKQTSDKYRDPDNKPNEYELSVIKYFKTHPDAKDFFAVHDKHDNITTEHLFYAYPLKVKKDCLKCHGNVNQIPKPIYEKLVSLYGNRAFNYKIGDIRGIISVKIPFYSIKSKITSIFVKVALVMIILYGFGVALFFRIYGLTVSDIRKVMKYLQEKLSFNKYERFTDEMHFAEFDEIKKALNKTAASLQKYQEELSKSLYINPLTDLPNRRKMLEDLAKRKVPIILLDIDSFKEVNYFYGEKIADEVVKSVAERLKDFNPYHLKVDQFGILYDKEISKEGIYELTKNLIKELEKPYIIGDNTIILKFRAGISYSKKDFMSAISALDATKILSKDIVFCSEAAQIREKYKQHLIWIKKIKWALANDKIVPFFQPIVDKNKKICKYETLVRLIDEDEKVISPYFFLEIAKKSRFYFEITKEVIRKAFEEFEEKECEFSVNITTMDMESEEIREFIISYVKKFKNPHRINFEIIESEDVKKSKRAFEFIKELKKHGCKIAIDDFGSGYANFDYLLSLGADVVKIDGSLIKDILSNKNSQIIVKTIVNFAKEVNMQTIAEYVENEEIFEYLKDLGVDCYQGYFYSPPKEKI